MKDKCIDAVWGLQCLFASVSLLCREGGGDAWRKVSENVGLNGKLGNYISVTWFQLSAIHIYILLPVRSESLWVSSCKQHEAELLIAFDMNRNEEDIIIVPLFGYFLVRGRFLSRSLLKARTLTSGTDWAWVCNVVSPLWFCSVLLCFILHRE